MACSQRSVAVVGAGISGLVCAGKLQRSGFDVAVFEKARGPGGRITTRRRNSERFDHGAQFFTAKTKAFSAVLEEWAAAEVVAPWSARFGLWSEGEFAVHHPRGERWVGRPRMSAIGRHLALGLPIQLATRVVRISRDQTGWRLWVEQGDCLGPFDAVVLSCPGPQAVELFPPDSLPWTRAARLQYASCWAVMLSFATPVSLPFDGIQWSHPMLAWSARDSSKPGRSPGERWVIHTQAAWSDVHIEDSPEVVAQAVASEWQKITGDVSTDISAHRWRFSLAKSKLDAPAFFDTDESLGLCGDGLAGPRIEDAWHSGRAMAQQIERALGVGP